MNNLTRSFQVARLLLAGLVLVGCGDDPFSLPDFDASLGVDIAQMTKTSSGLYYEDLVVGSGDAAGAGDVAEVSYTGWLANGSEFDSGSFSFAVGMRQVIPGFDEGVTGMKVGGRRLLVIPPDLAYGKQGIGPIPGDATLVFEVELLSLS